MNYTIINSQSSIDELMKTFNGFHDSCITEIHYVSGAHVNENRAINPFDSIRTVTIIFQSQCAVTRTIEIKFENVVRLNLCPKTEMQDAVIYGASIFRCNNLLYWSSLCDIEISELGKADFTWISAEKISWRIIDSP